MGRGRALDGHRRRGGPVGLAALLALVRVRLLARRPVEAPRTVTWDCGYAGRRHGCSTPPHRSPIPSRVSSRVFLRTRRRFTPPEGLFPSASSFSTETPDVYRERMYRPAFSTVERFLARFRRLQHGRLNLYILYIVIALVALLCGS